MIQINNNNKGKINYKIINIVMISKHSAVYNLDLLLLT